MCHTSLVAPRVGLLLLLVVVVGGAFAGQAPPGELSGPRSCAREQQRRVVHDKSRRDEAAKMIEMVDETRMETILSFVCKVCRLSERKSALEQMHHVEGFGGGLSNYIWRSNKEASNKPSTSVSDRNCCPNPTMLLRFCLRFGDTLIQVRTQHFHHISSP